MLNKQFDLIWNAQIDIDKSNLGSAGSSLYQAEQLRKEMWQLFNLDQVEVVSEID